MPAVFEDKSDEIDELLKKSRGKWQLHSLQWIDYDDVSQKIRVHVYNKWHLWDQEKEFGPWCRTVISNQISNLIRNNYGSFSKPCLRCDFNMGNDACSLTGSGDQDSQCELFDKWVKKKKRIHDVKLPLPIEDNTVFGSVNIFSEFDFEKSAAALHEKVKNKLTNDKHKKIYHLIYVEELEDEDVAILMGFKPDHNKKKAKYKQINNLQKRFVALAKKVLEEEDVIE
tara:strand:+ start:210 stop:890 length:681 start_codon:yes stop_codon:yes gene_type:complete